MNLTTEEQRRAFEAEISEQRRAANRQRQSRFYQRQRHPLYHDQFPIIQNNISLPNSTYSNHLYNDPFLTHSNMPAIVLSTRNNRSNPSQIFRDPLHQHHPSQSFHHPTLNPAALRPSFTPQLWEPQHQRNHSDSPHLPTLSSEYHHDFQSHHHPTQHSVPFWDPQHQRQRSLSPHRSFHQPENQRSRSITQIPHLLDSQPIWGQYNEQIRHSNSMHQIQSQSHSFPHSRLSSQSLYHSIHHSQSISGQNYERNHYQLLSQSLEIPQYFHDTLNQRLISPSQWVPSPHHEAHNIDSQRQLENHFSHLAFGNQHRISHPHENLEVIDSPALSPISIPLNWDDNLPEIDLRNIEDHVNIQLSQQGFENPHPSNNIQEPELQQNWNEIEDEEPEIQQHRPIAWGWREPPRFRPYTMRIPRNCQHCGAILFMGETSALCCRHGKINLPHSPPPPELLQMFKNATQDHSVSGNQLMRNIRLINSNFAFTSLGLNSETRMALNNQQQGVYTFKVKGSIHHRIGSLLPPTQQRPQFLQLYFYDTANEFENRHAHGPDLPPDLMRNIQNILHRHNSLIQQFESLASEGIPNRAIRLTDNAPNLDQRVYNLPRGDQIAAVWVEGKNFIT